MNLSGKSERAGKRLFQMAEASEKQCSHDAVAFGKTVMDGLL